MVPPRQGYRQDRLVAHCAPERQALILLAPGRSLGGMAREPVLPEAGSATSAGPIPVARPGRPHGSLPRRLRSSPGCKRGCSLWPQVGRVAVVARRGRASAPGTSPGRAACLPASVDRLLGVTAFVGARLPPAGCWAV